jgi:hypothetical protein
LTEESIDKLVRETNQILNTVNRHLAEEPECKCTIREIMKEAFVNE